MTRRVNKDCPFTAEELDELRAALYNVNTSFHCCNAAQADWAAGWKRNDIRKTRLESHNLQIPTSRSRVMPCVGAGL